MKTKVWMENGIELKVFEDKDSAIEWISKERYQNKYALEIVGEEKGLRSIIIIVKARV